MSDRYEVSQCRIDYHWGISDTRHFANELVCIINKKGNSFPLKFWDQEDAENFAAALNMGQASRDAKKEQGVDA